MRKHETGNSLIIIASLTTSSIISHCMQSFVYCSHTRLPYILVLFDHQQHPRTIHVRGFDTRSLYYEQSLFCKFVSLLARRISLHGGYLANREPYTWIIECQNLSPSTTPRDGTDWRDYRSIIVFFFAVLFEICTIY